MEENKTPVINIGGTEYELCFTLNAAKAIAEKYGELENVGEALFEKENMMQLFDDVVWLVELLANQGIKQYNFTHKEAPKELLTAEEIGLFCNPVQFVEFKDAILGALLKGSMRNILSEDTIKNMQGE